MSTLILFLFSSNWPRGSLVVSSHQKNISPSIRLPNNVSESLKKGYLAVFLPSHLFVGEEETDQHCVLLNPEHLADVQGAAREEEIEEEGDQDADGEQQVEAGEPDHSVLSMFIIVLVLVIMVIILTMGYLIKLVTVILPADGFGSSNLVATFDPRKTRNIIKLQKTMHKT